MTHATPARWTQFLSPTEWEQMGDPAQWRWITPWVDAQSTTQATVGRVTQQHHRWAQGKGNTHSPPHREIMLMLKGSAVYFYNGEVHWRDPGTVILLERHATRDLKGSVLKRGFSCLWLHLVSREHLTFYINTCDARGRYVHELPMRSLSGDIPRLLMEAWDECAAASSAALALPAEPWRGCLARRLLEARVFSSLAEILRSAEVESPENHHEQVVRSVRQYIGHHLADDLSLHSLANIAGYSAFFFHRLFLRHTGQTPVQYVNAARLAKAQELLTAHYTVEATALAIGFSSVSYFHQFFKRHLRLTPRAWCERHSPYSP